MMVYDDMKDVFVCLCFLLKGSDLLLCSALLAFYLISKVFADFEKTQVSGSLLPRFTHSGVYTTLGS